MKLLSALLPCISVALALQPEPQPPAPTHFPEEIQVIESRVDMTFRQNWVVNGGTWLSGIAAMGTLVRQIILDMSGKGTCTTTIHEYTNSKRDLEDLGVAVDDLTVKLAGHGYASYGNWHLHENGTQTFDGFFTSDKLRLDNFWVSANYTGGAITVLGNETSTGLEERSTTWSHKKIIVEYHSRAGVCKTRLTTDQLDSGIDVQLTKMSELEEKCSCWTYTGGDGWYGELKFMEIDDGDVMDGACYDRACNAVI
ncbi:hypothetical protein N7540_004420 [Penicillium herquei]|nr:hypothetical protein N7540_004420 [Penicillium herquei]